MRFRRSYSAAAVIGMWLVGAAVAKAATVTHQKSDGTFVQAAAGQGFNSAFVQASRTAGSGGPSQYFLFYSAQTCDGGFPILTCNGVRGFGNVPGGTVQANDKTARVTVDTSAVAGFTNSTYHLVLDISGDEPIGSETEAPGPGGPVDVSWRANGQYQFSSSGTNTVTNGAFTLKTVGTQDGAIAPANGSVIGNALVDPQGSLATNHNVQITVISP